MDIIDSDVASSFLSTAFLSTPLGSIVVIADEKVLYLVEFIDRKGLAGTINHLKIRLNKPLIASYTKPIYSIEIELQRYFSNALAQFDTPLCYIGSDFQKRVWTLLQKIPYGTTCSYRDIAIMLGNKHGYRAVGQANSKNLFSIIVPCHRVIGANGSLSGYNGGLMRKQWLLKHENNKYIAKQLSTGHL